MPLERALNSEDKMIQSKLAADEITEADVAHKAWSEEERKEVISH